jgi:hypothetical protein
MEGFDFVRFAAVMRVIHPFRSTVIP